MVSPEHLIVELIIVIILIYQYIISQSSKCMCTTHPSLLIYGMKIITHAVQLLFFLNQNVYKYATQVQIQSKIEVVKSCNPGVHELSSSTP